MIFSPMNHELGFICRFGICCISRVFSRAMGCLFTCLRVEDSRRKSHSDSDSSRAKSSGSGSQSPKSQLSSLFLLEDIEEDSPGNGEEVDDSPAVGIKKQLRDEARFLKACGTLIKTPDEIRKVPSSSSKPNDSVSHDGSSSMEKPLIGSQVAIDEPSIQCSSSRSNNFLETDANLKTASKFVRFGNGVHILNNTDSASPNPTPFKLTDEMQTPGTAFPASVELESLQSGMKKMKRVRAQYVCPAPAASIVQWKEMDKPEISTPARDSWPTGSPPGQDCRHGLGEASLSSWLKPKPSSHKPLRTTVAVTEPGLWKPWNGNGIPNSTNKYKEDQKVKWHATPFEERLEKALYSSNQISEMYANF